MIERPTYDSGAYSFVEPLRGEEIDEIVSDEGATALITNCTASIKTWQRINDRLLARRPGIRIGIGGIYSDQPYDLSCLEQLSNVRKVSLSSIHHAINVESVTELPHLEELTVGIFDLTSFDFLRDVSAGLRGLSLGETNSKRPRLRYLERFRDLEWVHIERHKKDIEVLSTLRKLSKVSLRFLSTAGLDYLRPLERLRSLEVKLGGIRDFSAIEGKESLEYLEIWMIRGLEELSCLARLPGLQYLWLEHQKQLKSLPSLKDATALRRAVLIGLPGLKDLHFLEAAPALEELEFHGDMEPEGILPALRNPSLRALNAGLGNAKRNRVAKEWIARHGKEPIEGGLCPFVFR